MDGYGCGATLWVTWQGSYDQVKRMDREWSFFYSERRPHFCHMSHPVSPICQRNSYDQVKRMDREWTRLDERERLEASIHKLATLAQQQTPSKHWPFAARVREHISRVMPAAFARSVRESIERLVSAYQHPETPFTAEETWNTLLPFLELSPELPTGAYTPGGHSLPLPYPPPTPPPSPPYPPPLLSPTPPPRLRSY